MRFWSDTYSWVEFLGSAVAAFVGLIGAIAAAWWQIRRQESQSVRELHDQMVVQAARELTAAVVALNVGMEKAWRMDGLPAAASALDEYNAAITAAGPVLHHVGLWDLALSTRTDANLFLREWRRVETNIGEALHQTQSRDSTEAAQFTHAWLLGHSRSLTRERPSKEVPVEWLRDAPIWADWVNCKEVALQNLSEQTLRGSAGFVRTLEVEVLPYWVERGDETASAWKALPRRTANRGSDSDAQ